jgi:hypothetical protein
VVTGFWVLLSAPAGDQGAIGDQLLLAGQLLGGGSERAHHPRQLRVSCSANKGSLSVGSDVAVHDRGGAELVDGDSD